MIKIEHKNGKIELTTPYLLALPHKLRQLGGKWNGEKWIFEDDSDIESSLKSMIKDHFAVDLDNTKYGTVKITVLDDISEWHEPVIAGGYVLAAARGRDSGANAEDGVLLLEGEITSGGSVKNWRSVVKGGSVFKIKNFPLSWDFDKDVYKIDVLEEYKEVEEPAQDEIDISKLLGDMREAAIKKDTDTLISTIDVLETQLKKRKM